MIRFWPIVLPIPALGWWLLGFPPGWGWLVQPMLPPMPVSLGMLVVLGLVVVGCWMLARLAVENV
jgi:hypothetical protein